jgi:hypothetical protein
MATKRSETTGPKAASAASRVLSDPSSTAKEKSAAASALTQVRAQNEQTRRLAASAASEVLRDPTSTAREKSAAASALTQAPPKAKGKT